MNKLLSTLSFLLLVAAGAYCQRVPVPTQIFHNYQLINPAYAGVVKKNEIGGNYRHRNYQGNFEYTRLHQTSLIYCRYIEKIKSGIGLIFLHQKFKTPSLDSFGGGYFSGPNGYRPGVNGYYFNVAYAGRIQIKGHKLVPGISFGYFRSKYYLRFDNLYDPNDPISGGELIVNINDFFWDMGIWYQFKGFDIGFSTNQLFFKAVSEPNSNSQQYRRYIIAAKYFHQFSEIFSISPNFYFNSAFKSDYGNELRIGYINTFKKIFSFGLVYKAQLKGRNDDYPYASSYHFLSPYAGFHIKDIIVLSLSFDCEVARSGVGYMGKEFVHEQNINAKF